MTMPRGLARPHAEVVKEAKQIVLAEVIDAKPSKIGDAKKPTIYVFRVVRVLKGVLPATMNLSGEGDLSGIWDTTFSDHSDDEFWKGSSGRMGISGDCSMVPPLFIRGKRYLLLLGGRADTKQFERVDAPADRWLKFVEKELSLIKGASR